MYQAFNISLADYLSVLICRDSLCLVAYFELVLSSFNAVLYSARFNDFLLCQHLCHLYLPYTVSPCMCLSMLFSGPPSNSLHGDASWFSCQPTGGERTAGHGISGLFLSYWSNRTHHIHDASGCCCCGFGFGRWSRQGNRGKVGSERSSDAGEQRSCGFYLAS